MTELNRHSRPSAESPETIVREKETVAFDDNGDVAVVTYAVIERHVPSRFGATEHRQTGAGVISVDAA